MVLQVSSKHRYNMSLLKQWFKVSAHTGIQADIGFQMSGYAVSESQGSLTLTVVVEGNVSRPFNVSITAVDGTASCESFIWLQINIILQCHLYYVSWILPPQPVSILPRIHPCINNLTHAARSDYELLQTLLTISPGISFYPINITIYDNTVVELTGFRRFSLNLTTVESSVMFTNRTSTITIYDNDCK